MPALAITTQSDSLAGQLAECAFALNAAEKTYNAANPTLTPIGSVAVDENNEENTMTITAVLSFTTALDADGKIVKTILDPVP